MNDEQRVFLRAVADVVKGKLATNGDGSRKVAIPNPTMTLEVPAPVINVGPTPVQVNNNVDLELIANAMVSMGEMNGQLVKVMMEHQQQMAAKMDELLSKLSEIAAKTPIFTPRIEVAAPQVTISPPDIHVDAVPSFPQREKRKLTIKHDDGTTSTVTEE